MLDLQQRELRYDQNGVVWEESGERPITAADVVDDGLDIPPALDRRAKPEPSLKDRLLGDIPTLGSAQDCLRWDFAMSTFTESLRKEDRDEIGSALLARQKSLSSNGAQAH